MLAVARRKPGPTTYSSTTPERNPRRHRTVDAVFAAYLLRNCPDPDRTLAVITTCSARQTPRLHGTPSPTNPRHRRVDAVYWSVIIPLGWALSGRADLAATCGAASWNSTAYAITARMRTAGCATSRLRCPAGRPGSPTALAAPTKETMIPQPPGRDPRINATSTAPVGSPPAQPARVAVIGGGIASLAQPQRCGTRYSRHRAGTRPG